ncbi:MAG: DUF4256 domain-containing protein [Bacteroidales bacterium]|nr:DUF4256 domain-containing protein [Bacteroidales bacterium]
MNKELTKAQQEELLSILKTRFDKNTKRHIGMHWEPIQTILEDPSNFEKVWSLKQMENTGGEPDVIAYNLSTNEYLFVDCSAESPTGRRSLCYDQQALDKRKENKPKNSAIALAMEMGIQVLTEEQYRELQTLGTFDAKTSSWIATPTKIRALGGALFCDFRYGKVFVYHNGAESYYAARGFRGFLKI